MHTPRIVVIGGGGCSALLAGLAELKYPISAVVNMVDDGGSSGRLRRTLRVRPVGDLRKCLTALSTGFRAKLFAHRFTVGPLGGHPVGNLALTVVSLLTGSIDTATQILAKIIGSQGQVIPVTEGDTALVAACKTGHKVQGENAVAQHNFHGERPRLNLVPVPNLNPRARAAILAADLIVIAPGSLYTSILPTLMVSGVREALQEAGVPIVMVANLTTEPGHTDGFTVSDYVGCIVRALFEGAVSHVVYNTSSHLLIAPPKGSWLTHSANEKPQALPQMFGVAFASSTNEKGYAVHRDGVTLAQVVITIAGAHFPIN